jgi:hypothetical protein
LAENFPVGLSAAILTRRAEAIVDDLLDSHSSLWIPGPVSVAAITLFDVFSQGKLDALRGFGKFHLLVVSPPPKFDDLVLTPDWIGRAVKNIRRRHASSELTVDRDVVAIDEITDANFSRDRLASLVHSTIRRHVRMAIDNARSDVKSLASTIASGGKGLSAASTSTIVPFAMTSEHSQYPLAATSQMVAPKHHELRLQAIPRRQTVRAES